MLTLFFQILIGSTLLGIFIIPKNNLEKISLSFLLGFGYTTLFIFLTTIFGIRLTSLVLLVIYIIAFFIALLLKNAIHLNQFKLETTPNKINEGLYIGIIRNVLILLSLMVLALSVYWPINGWDALALYDSRALIYSKGGLLTDLFEQTGNNVGYFGYYFNSYPPSTSLAHASIYLLDKWISPSFFYPLFFISLIVLFLNFLKSIVGEKVAYVFTLLLAVNSGISGQASIAYTNLPYITYFFVSLVLLQFWDKSQKISVFILSYIFLIFSIWIRALEPFYWINIVITFFILLKRRRGSKKYLFTLSLLILAVPISRSLWFCYVANIIDSVGGMPGNPLSFLGLISGLSVLTLDKIFEVCAFVFNYLGVNVFIILALMVSFLLNITLAKKYFVVFIASALLITSIFLGPITLEITIGGIENIPDSIARGVLISVPISLFYLAIFFNSYKSKVRQDENIF